MSFVEMCIKHKTNPSFQQRQESLLCFTALPQRMTQITLHQGCQIVHFQTKDSNLGKYWRVLQWKMLIYFISIWYSLRTFGIVFGHLVYFLVIWYICPRFGMLQREKSGNPGDYILSDNKDFVFRSDCLNQPQKRKNNKRLTDKKTERNVGDRREKWPYLPYLPRGHWSKFFVGVNRAFEGSIHF
jgi:hypothetical protein